MGIFRQFPYANFHDMNLNWLLAKMKELGIDEETFKAAIEAQFAGLKQDFEDFTFTVDAQIIAEVDKWLDEHPEATTTVEDGSISLQKLTDKLKYWVLCPSEYNFDNICRLPYRRNIEAGMQGGVCTESNIFYQYSNNNNELTKFNINSGIVINQDTIALGHCNSMAFIEDENKLLCYGTFGADSLPYNRLTVIDGDSLAVLDQVDLYIPSGLNVGVNPTREYGYMCSFDNENNCLYVAGQCYAKSTGPSYILKYNYENGLFVYDNYGELPAKLAASASDMCCAKGSNFILTSENPQIIILDSDYSIEHVIPVNRKVSDLTYASEFESISIVNDKIIVGYRGSCFKNQYGAGSYVYAESNIANSVEETAAVVPEFQKSISLYVDNSNNAIDRDGSSSNPFNNIYEALNCAYNFSNVTIYDTSQVADEFVIAVEYSQNVVVNAENSAIMYGIRMDGGDLFLISPGYSKFAVSGSDYYLYLENMAHCIINRWTKPNGGNDLTFEDDTVRITNGSILKFTLSGIKNLTAIRIAKDSFIEEETDYAGDITTLIRDNVPANINPKSMHGFRSLFTGDPINKYIPINASVLLRVQYNSADYYLSGQMYGTPITWDIDGHKVAISVARTQQWGKLSTSAATGVTIVSLEVWI